MSVRRHEQQTRTSDSGHGVLGVWLPFCGAGSFETYGGGILVVVEGDAAIPGLSGPQCGVSGWLPMLLLAEAGSRKKMRRSLPPCRSIRGRGTTRSEERRVGKECRSRW